MATLGHREIRWWIASFVVLQSCGTASTTAADLAAVDAGDQMYALLTLTPEESVQHFDALEKWATIGRPHESTARYAIRAIGASGHPRSLELLKSLSRKRGRTHVLRALYYNRDKPGFCETLADDWVRGPDPIDEREDLLRRAMVKGVFRCSSHLEPLRTAHPERVAAILDGDTE